MFDSEARRRHSGVYTLLSLLLYYAYFYSPHCSLAHSLSLTLALLLTHSLSHSHYRPLTLTHNKARSVRLAAVGSGPLSLMVGMGDGNLLIYPLHFSQSEADNEMTEEGGKETVVSLGSRRQLSLGSQPVHLSLFTSSSNSSSSSISVFAACDRPTVIYAGDNGRMLFANVTVGEVSHMSPFNAQCFPNSLALVIRVNGQEKLTIGITLRFTSQINMPLSVFLSSSLLFPYVYAC